MNDHLADHDDVGDRRGAGELILGVLTGSALLPFVQALATKAGEDVYQLVRAKLTRRARKRAEAELAEAGTVTVADQDRRVVLELPATMSAAMSAKLDDVRLPVRPEGWLLVRWDEGRSRWVVEQHPEPPDAANFLE
ncbi:MAG: hypothetical protein HOV94_15275 [Saccharothrix sp.]|nr:hypothetical protein [Saccharothrix sp.]